MRFTRNITEPLSKSSSGLEHGWNRKEVNIPTFVPHNSPSGRNSDNKRFTNKRHKLIEGEPPPNLM